MRSEIEKAKIWVNKNFHNNPGSFDYYIWPINHEQAEKQFDYFIKHKLRAKYYIRYADDFVIFSRDKDCLLKLIPKIENFRCNTFEELCLIKDERNVDAIQ